MQDGGHYFESFVELQVSEATTAGMVGAPHKGKLIEIIFRHICPVWSPQIFSTLKHSVFSCVLSFLSVLSVFLFSCTQGIVVKSIHMVENDLNRLLTFLGIL